MLTQSQRVILLAGIQSVSQAGYRMSFTIVDEPALCAMILAVMPDAIIIYRFVAGASDGNPRGPGDVFISGEAWFERLWGENSKGQGATYFQFVNEWLGNSEADNVYAKFATFYTQLGDACFARRVIPTFGDFSQGTPPDANNVLCGEAARFKQLDPMFTYAALHGIPINVHLYSPEGAGAFNMAPGAPYYTLRWIQIASRYPGLKIIGGEGGNFGNGGRTFDPVLTPQCMVQYAWMLRQCDFLDQLLGVHWWGVVDGNAHKDWAADDITPILPWFFTWSAHGQT